MLKDRIRACKGVAAIRCDGEDIVRLTATRGKFAAAARAVEAIDPESIELLNDQGEVLRVITLREDDDDDDDDRKGKLSELSELATVIGSVSDRAAQRHQEAYTVGFNALTQVVGLIVERLNSLERAWAKVIQVEYQRAAEKAEAGEDAEMSETLKAVLQLAAANKKKAPEDSDGEAPEETEGEE